MKYLTLLGDSVFDNEHYNSPGEGSLGWFRRFAPKGWEVILGATDGAVLSSISHQERKVHPLSSEVLLSVGGNDVLKERWRLSTFKGKELWRSLRVGAADFALRYERMLSELLPLLPFFQNLTLCTIYGGDFEGEQNIINAAISLFNRQILLLAKRRGLRVLDLYSLLQGKEFFVFSIEPSSLGSATMAHHFWKGVT